MTFISSPAKTKTQIQYGQFIAVVLYQTPNNDLRNVDSPAGWVLYCWKPNNSSSKGNDGIMRLFRTQYF